MVITQTIKWTLFERTCSLLSPNADTTSCKIWAAEIDQHQDSWLNCSKLSPSASCPSNKYQPFKNEGANNGETLVKVNLAYKLEEGSSKHSQLQQCKSFKKIF